MSEFGNRIKAQRELLRIVNSHLATSEELYGLSEPAIDRWLAVSRISQSSEIAKLLKTASEKLYFLANKSQEQITEEYKSLIDEFKAIADLLKSEISLICAQS